MPWIAQPRYTDYLQAGLCRLGESDRFADDLARRRQQIGQLGKSGTLQADPRRRVEVSLASSMDDCERPALEGGLLGSPGERSLRVLGSVDTDDDGPGSDSFVLHVLSLAAGKTAEYGHRT